MNLLQAEEAKACMKEAADLEAERERTRGELAAARDCLQAATADTNKTVAEGAGARGSRL